MKDQKSLWETCTNCVLLWCQWVDFTSIIWALFRRRKLMERMNCSSITFRRRTIFGPLSPQNWGIGNCTPSVKRAKCSCASQIWHQIKCQKTKSSMYKMEKKFEVDLNCDVLFKKFFSICNKCLRVKVWSAKRQMTNMVLSP